VAFAQTPTENDPLAQIEHFLAEQHEVVDCRVWQKRGDIYARVTVGQDSNLNGADLQAACRVKLGIHLAPRLILMERVAPISEERAA
jgi:hypothetical protein